MGESCAFHVPTRSKEQLLFSWANTAVEPRSIIASSEIMALSFMMYFTQCMVLLLPIANS